MPAHRNCYNFPKYYDVTNEISKLCDESVSVSLVWKSKLSFETVSESKLANLPHTLELYKINKIVDRQYINARYICR